MIVRMNIVETPRSISGIIIRDEQVHYASSSGYVEFLVHDNDRVGVNTPVAIITSDFATAQEAMGHLENMATQSRRPGTGAADSSVQRINNYITNIVNGRIHSFAVLNLSEIYSLRDNVNQRVITRNQISASSVRGSREPLARDYERHRAALEASTSNMYAVGSGIMSRMIDNYESRFTRDSIGYLTRDCIRAIEDDVISPVVEVQAGEPVFKTVGNVWHIATYMPNDMINFSVGQTRIFYLHNATTSTYEPHSLRVERIDDGIRYSLVVFRNTRHVIEFMNQRNISIRTSSGVRRGLKIPDTAIVTNRHYRIPFSSLHHDDGHYYALVLTETGNIRIPVTFDEYTEYYAFVHDTAGLTVGSTLVPRDADVGQHLPLRDEYVRIVNGVYAVVFGRVTFSSIDLGGSGLEAGYVLLDPALSHGIREFTNIIIDASTVVEGQTIR